MKKQMQFRIKRDYPRMNDSNFETKMLMVETGLTNNPNFPALPIPIAQLSSARQAYSAALIASKNRGMIEAAQKSEARQVATVAMDTLASYCESVATTRSVLLSSGFSVTSDARSKRTLGKAANLVVTPGAKSGTMEMSIDTCDNATSYQFMAAPNPNKGIWKSVPSTTASAIITELTPLILWDFKAIAVGTNGQTSETDVITKPVA